MSEERTAAVFQELLRIGVDPTTLSAPLIGTGLRASDLVAWLREIPDGSGIDELSRRLEARAGAVTPRYMVKWRRTAGPPPEQPRRRWWPTLELLNASVDMLLEEWDPFGVRLAGTDREAIAMFAYYFVGPFLEPNGMIDPITHTTEMIASAERDRLALAPSPERHRRYLATRLRDVVSQHPVPPGPERPNRSTVVVEIREDAGPPPLDPEGVCSRCFTFGTVARVTTMSSPPRSKRFCERCWTEVRESHFRHPTPPKTAAEHIAWMDRTGRPATSSLSRSWLDTIDLIGEIAKAPPPREANIDERRAYLAELAREIVRREDTMYGPMPPVVQAFVHEYAPK